MKLFILVAVILSSHQTFYEATLITDRNILPSEWPGLKGKFGFAVQSPTDIETKNAVAIDLDSIVLCNFHSMPKEAAYLENTGYYFEILVREDLKERPYITGGPMYKDQYLLQQAHFHWGDNDDHGSEYHVDGKWYSTEIHVVCFKKDYETFKNSVNYADGVVVVSFFGTATDNDNPIFDDFMKKIPQIVEPESRVAGSFQDEFKFLDTLFQQDTYYAIPGSLTTDPYQECVTWILYMKPFQISHQQLAAFRTLKTSDKKGMIRHNDRELQEFGQRPIITPKKNKTPVTNN